MRGETVASLTKECRSVGHKWKHVSSWRDSAGGPWSEYECEGCGLRERQRGSLRAKASRR